MTSSASMASKPARIVDAHVHLWDPARSDWYPYLSTTGAAFNMGDVSGMSRRFDVSTYLSESIGWNVEKLVNVAAATGRHSID
jgi:L-fuconolactonase